MMGGLTHVYNPSWIDVFYFSQGDFENVSILNSSKQKVGEKNYYIHLSFLFKERKYLEENKKGKGTTLN